MNNHTGTEFSTCFRFPSSLSLEEVQEIMSALFKDEEGYKKNVIDNVGCMF